MNNNKTKLLQNKLLAIMEVFHEACMKNNLSYYMLGGTMLGAVRHQGFIPWDDDIDVGMSRSDYEKLINLPNSAWPEELIIKTPHNSNDFVLPFSKIMNKNTTLIEKRNDEEVVGGIFIDVFPIDGAGSSMFQAKAKYMLFAIKRRLISYNLEVKAKDNFIERLIQKQAKHIEVKNLYASLEKTMKKDSFQDSKIVGNYAGAWGVKEFMPKNVLGKPKLYQFENHKFYGVNKADEYLTSLYGDYMKLPPKDKRKSNHTIVELDLDKSYEVK